MVPPKAGENNFPGNSPIESGEMRNIGAFPATPQTFSHQQNSQTFRNHSQLNWTLTIGLTEKKIQNQIQSSLEAQTVQNPFPNKMKKILFSVF